MLLRVLLFSGGVCVFITITIASFVVRVACTVIFNYYHSCDFVFVGWRARLFFKMTTTFTSFVFSGWRARLFFNY